MLHIEKKSSSTIKHIKSQQFATGSIIISLYYQFSRKMCKFHQFTSKKNREGKKISIKSFLAFDFLLSEIFPIHDEYEQKILLFTLNVVQSEDDISPFQNEMPKTCSLPNFRRFRIINKNGFDI